MTNTRHWTERSIEDFAYSVASDFIDLLREEMDRLRWSKARLAKAAGVSKGRITQIFKDPGNLEVVTMVKFAKALRLKTVAFPYKDINDPNNERGPINAEVFRKCWENAQRPADMWDIKKISATTNTVDYQTLLKDLNWGREISNRMPSGKPRLSATPDVLETAIAAVSTQSMSTISRSGQ